MSDPSPPVTHRLVVADDHPVVRIGVRNILAAAPDLEIVGECSDGEAALAMVQSHSPDLLILDLAMPKLSGIEVLRALKNRAPSQKTLVLAGSVDRRQTLEILQLGGRGILLKDVVAERLATACRAVLSGLGFNEAQADEAIDDVRSRDAQRVELELVGGLSAGRVLIRGNMPTPQPEPFFPPRANVD